eukprot:jgi/Botrbrau1/8435/Bobra.0237s0054.1
MLGATYIMDNALFGRSCRTWYLLVVLYMMQGVPMGLTSGSIPFLLQANVSYTQIGIFSIASYPYSFKLLWSPIVDSIYSSAIGRRKTWIVPIQLVSALVMMAWAGWADAALQRSDMVGITALFFVLVLLAATQDIAVGRLGSHPALPEACWVRFGMPDRGDEHRLLHVVHGGSWR